MSWVFFKKALLKKVPKETAVGGGPLISLTFDEFKITPFPLEKGKKSTRP